MEVIIDGIPVGGPEGNREHLLTPSTDRAADETPCELGL